MPADAQMQQYVELAGNVGRLIKQEVVRTFMVSDYIDTLMRMGGMDTGLMPYNCVYLKEGKYEGNRAQVGSSYRLHVCLDRPRVAAVRFEGRDETGDRLDKTLTLALPWTVTFVLYRNNGLSTVVYLALLAPEGLHPAGLDTELYCLPLPNMTNGNFCLGSLRVDATLPFSERTNRTIRFIQESTWNNDLWPRFGKSVDDTPNVTSLTDWNDKTVLEGGGFWRKLRLIPRKHTLGTLIKELTA